jgi:hypothetical protein
MSATTTLSPQVIGQAERAHQPLMDRILARSGTTFPQWVALGTVAAGGGDVSRDEVRSRLTGAIKISDAAAAEALAGLTTAGLLHVQPDNGSRVGLTAPGRERYREIRAAVDQVTDRLYGSIPPSDLATAGRVLALITARANELAAEM